MRSLVKFAVALIVLASIGWSIGPTFAQGFMVQPMTMRTDPRAGQSLDIPLTIHNTAVGGPKTIQLRLVDLTQGSTGGWELSEPGSTTDLSGHASSLAWTTISQSSADIEPDQPATVTVTVKPPANARGVYFAGIVAETPLPANPVGVVVRTRFLIPLIVEIKGRSVPEHVALTDTSMLFGSVEPGAPPTTTAYMSVANTGQTFSRVRGDLTIESPVADKWRVITRAPIEERGIIPGAVLKLGYDLERRLPSGKYRVDANLFVDGRRVAPLKKEIDFKGDAEASIAFDNTLLLQPGSVDMKVVPGATRTTVMHIENAGSDPVQIAISAQTPRSLMGVQMGNLLGTDLSAEPWVKIEPSSFTLRANGRQNVRVISSVPAGGAEHPNYYADLVLAGRYASGQSAGETISTIRLTNGSMKASQGGLIERLVFAEGENSSFIANLDFVNTGEVDVHPAAKVTVSSSSGEALISQSLEEDSSRLLPLARRRFSGELSLATLPPGDYSVAAVVDIGTDKPVLRNYALSIHPPSGEGDDQTTPIAILTDPTTDGPAGNVELNKETQVLLGATDQK